MKCEMRGAGAAALLYSLGTRQRRRAHSLHARAARAHPPIVSSAVHTHTSSPHPPAAASARACAAWHSSGERHWAGADVLDETEHDVWPWGQETETCEERKVRMERIQLV